MPTMQRRKTQVQAKTKTSQWRKFKGMNRTDARTAIDDDELFWLENVIPVGNGALQIVPTMGPTVASVADGRTIWGGTINGNAVMLVITDAGAISQVTPAGVVTSVAPAGAVTVNAHITTYQGARFLIVDPTKGYSTWDGTTYSVIDVAKIGVAIAVFEGRVWIAINRTITFTAPNSYTDFSIANGGGSTIITDDAFQGNVISLYSALEQLWVVGQSAIEAIGNVSATGIAPSVVTTFTITNIVTNLGSNAPNSVIAYFRALTLLSPYGAYALSGVTPQKLSDKLDGLFANLTFTDAPAAIAVVQNLLVLMYLVTYNGTDLSPAWASTTAPLLLCFTQGKWFVSVQDLNLRSITTLVVSGVTHAYGIVGAAGDVHQLFGSAADVPVNWKVQSKLYDFGSSTQAKALLKVGLEFQASAQVDPSMTVDSEFGSLPVDVTTSNVLQLTNASGEIITFTNTGAIPLIFVTQGTVLSRQAAAAGGRYLGWTVSGTDVPFRVQAVQFEVALTREWQP